jgi:nucleosome binding factor SPN SPT16 subunit
MKSQGMDQSLVPTIVEWNTKTDSVQSVVDKVLSQITDQKLQTVATWTKDKPDGDLTNATLNTLSIKGAKIVDLKEITDQINQVKTSSELKNLKVAAAFTEWTFTKIISEVEDILDGDLQVKHSVIQKRIENALDNADVMKQFTSKHPGCEKEFLDYPIPIMIQSGGEFNVQKFQIESNNDKL